MARRGKIKSTGSLAGTGRIYQCHEDYPFLRVAQLPKEEVGRKGILRVHVKREGLREREVYVAFDIPKAVLLKLVEKASRVE